MTVAIENYSGATFIASTVTDATNAEQLVITLAGDVVAPIAADQVYVTYSGSDLDDAAGNQVTQFTKLVDVSRSNLPRMQPPMGSPEHRLMPTGR